ncbi:hypothetical protein ABT403_13885 [Streptomyces sp. NPDC000075]|uniref:hypothetical protein n=1 Tax=Streptomyces TaxID=1883 RepID=UPI0031DB2F4E
MGSTDFALKQAGAARVNEAFGTTLAKDATFMKRMARPPGQPGLSPTRRERPGAGFVRAR